MSFMKKHTTKQTIQTADIPAALGYVTEIIKSFAIANDSLRISNEAVAHKLSSGSQEEQLISAVLFASAKGNDSMHDVHLSLSTMLKAPLSTAQEIQSSIELLIGVLHAGEIGSKALRIANEAFAQKLLSGSDAEKVLGTALVGFAKANDAIEDAQIALNNILKAQFLPVQAQTRSTVDESLYATEKTNSVMGDSSDDENVIIG